MLAFVIGSLSFQPVARPSVRVESRAASKLASASTSASCSSLPLPAAAPAALCAVTLCTGSSQHEGSTVQTLVGEVVATHTSGRRQGTVKVRPTALRTCHGTRARALLSLDPSLGWFHEPQVSSDVRVFAADAPAIYVPTSMTRAASASERTVVGLLRQTHDAVQPFRSDEHYTALEAFYSLS